MGNSLTPKPAHATKPQKVQGYLSAAYTALGYALQWHEDEESATYAEIQLLRDKITRLKADLIA